ncbi:uncharacterized protein LOC114523723 isoform X2 [Dendronephthya gigantea]|uniref:uncharacterized protein LOC114523723 isoform X2 n=1 Tax=Dendronephthya gigantea TaxID=151771 RepID=UPI00106A5F2D|nr:uncharacterized protein LOC114523723 isoform X2 [Dendronephthya gigantea]
MAPVNKTLLSIARCSSQDPTHRAENILNKDKKWLSSKHDKSGQIEAEIHLSKAIQIGYINIGNFGSAFVELLVGSSMWPSGKDYVTLLPSTTLMSPAESKTGRNILGVKMFDKASFTKDVPEEEWDRVRVVCRQPFTKDKQFGLQFVDIIEGSNLENSASNKAKTPQRQSLAEFRSKLLGTSPRLQPQNRPTSSLFGHLTSPKSSRAAGLVQAALKGNVETKGKNHQPKQRKIRSHPYDRPANGNAELQSLQRHKTLSRRTAGDIEDEVECFLETYDFFKMPLETITYKELKEQMEKMRGAKLTKEERKVFIRLTEEQVERVKERRKDLQKFDEGFSPAYSTSTKSSNPTPSRAMPPRDGTTSPRDRPISPRDRPTSSRDIPTSPPVTLTLPCETLWDTPTSSCYTPDLPRDVPSLPRDFSTSSRDTVAQSSVLHECPLCEKFFPPETIELHASGCVGSTIHETVILSSSDERGDLEIMSPIKSASADHMFCCPVCMDRIPKWRINIHANVCADACG